MRKSPYYDKIKTILGATKDFQGFDPRHVEAYMRVDNSTLDGLSASDFKQQCIIAAAAVKIEGVKIAERLAMSFGL